MELFLQFGYGMMQHASELLKEWGGGGVVLSPRDLSYEQMKRAASAYRKLNGTILIDPQCYVHDGDLEKMHRYDYWSYFSSTQTIDFLHGNGLKRVIKEIFKLNSEIGADYVILPGIICNSYGKDWKVIQDAIITESSNIKSQLGFIPTISLSASLMCDEAQVEEVIDYLEGIEIEGVYLIAEAPAPYLVDDPRWIGNLLNLVAALKLQGKYVLVGYGNHQMSFLAAAKCDVICSGTWMNVRAFSRKKFYEPEQTGGRRVTWYYAPQALSEYKIPYLDIAKREGVLHHMDLLDGFERKYCKSLFSGVQPSSVSWSEQLAFRHYLCTLRTQIKRMPEDGFDNLYAYCNDILEYAKIKNKTLRDRGVSGEIRDFGNYIDPTISGLKSLRGARGAELKRNWKNL